METKKSLKAFTSILTKVAGLVFFAFLAISLGVIFGTLFKDWVSEDPLSPVQGLNEPYQEPLSIKLPDQEGPSDTSSSYLYSDDYFPADKTVSFKVQVGPFQVREEALQVAGSLQSEGYPVFVSKGLPCYVQVGAFSNPNNASNLQNELLSKGYSAYIKEE
ncbi:MAG TPA: SPOR domain-containing protein [Hydrogenispora sp.]|nr:SPOR domain-containing protein [Hydrogenispora sp.]